MKNDLNMLIAGLGGQGVISAGHILSEAALKEGLDFKTFGSYGMAQRGGSVYLHFRTGDVYSPKSLEGSCHLVVGLEFMEGMRNAHFTSSSGTMILNKRLTMPPGSTKLEHSVDEMIELLKQRFDNVFVLELEQELATNIKRGLNVAMLGAAFAAKLIPISLENIKESIASYAPKRKELNLKAFEIGYAGFENLQKR